MAYMKLKESKLYEKFTKLTVHKHRFFFKHKWELTEKEGEKQIQKNFFRSNFLVLGGFISCLFSEEYTATAPW